MVNCFVSECKHYHGKTDCIFFSFPRDENERKIWIKNISRQDREPSASSRVCNCHFKGGCKGNGPTVFWRKKNKVTALKSPEKKKRSGDSFSEGGFPPKIKTDPDSPDPVEDKNRNKKRRTYSARSRALKLNDQPTPTTQNPVPNMLLVASSCGINPQLYVVPDIPAELSTESSSSCHNDFELSQKDIGIKIKEEPVDSVPMERDSNDAFATNGGSLLHSILIQEHPITIKQEPMFTEEP